MIHFHSPINFKLCPGHFNASWDLGNLFTSDTLYEAIDNVDRWGVSECYGHPIFISIKENWICVMNRNHAKLNIKILLTINLLFGSDSEAIL